MRRIFSHIPEPEGITSWSVKRLLSRFALGLIPVLIPVLIVALTPLFAYAAVIKEPSRFREIWDTVWLFLNFFILMAVIIKFGRKPIRDFLVNHGSEINETVNTTLDNLKNAEAEYQDKIERLKGLRDKINELTNMNQEQANLARKRIINEAEAVSDQIIAEAKISAEVEIRNTTAKVKTEMIEMAYVEAEKRLAELINENDESRLINEYISSIQNRES